MRSTFLRTLLCLLIVQPMVAIAQAASKTAVPTDSLFAIQWSSHPFYDPVRLAIRDSSTWRALQTGRLTVPATTVIDFSSQMVIVAGLGKQPHADKTVRIDSVYRVGGQLEVIVVTRAPGCNRWTHPVSMTPLHIVAVPRSTLPIVWVEHLELYCRKP